MSLKNELIHMANVSTDLTNQIGKRGHHVSYVCGSCKLDLCSGDLRMTNEWSVRMTDCYVLPVLVLGTPDQSYW